MSGQYDAFDNVDEASVARPDKPIWKLLTENAPDDELHKWLMAEKSWLESENRERFRTVHRNLSRYKGLQYLSQELRQVTRDNTSEELAARRIQKIVANHVYDLVQNGIARTVKYRPAVAVLPTTDDFEDKTGSKMAKNLLDHLWYVQEFDGLLQPEFHKNVRVMGECYLGIVWDENAGDAVEGSDKIEESLAKGEKKVTLTDKEGKPELGDDGKPIIVDRPIKNGDVVYEVWLTLDVLLDRKRRWKQVDYMFRREILDVYEARLRFPGNDEKLSEEQNALEYDFEAMAMKSQKGKVVLWHFYHRHTIGLCKGANIVFSSKGIVKKNKKGLGYDHGKLPCTRLTDIEIPGELHGHSGIETVAGLIGAYNNLTNATIENLVMCGRPKWAFPAGSVRRETLGNAITMVEFKGPVAPTLLSMNPTPPEVYKLRAELREEFRQIYGIFGVSRGEPPPGIKAGVALQFLSEQENERGNEGVLKSNEWIKQTAIMTLAVAGQNYEKDDKRLIQILGKNNKWQSAFFDVASLQNDYDVRIQNSSALPQSKPARTQTLFDLNERFPDQVSGEQVLEMLDMSQEEKFYDTTTRSVRAAQAENEQIIEGPQGTPINDPMEYEDHIQHWKEHVGRMREWDFKNQTPEERQNLMIDHVRATELLMSENAKLNPEYMKAVMALPGFPAVYKPEIAPPNDGRNPDQEQQIPTALLDQLAGSMQAPPPAEAPPEGAQPFPPQGQLAQTDLQGAPAIEPMPSADSQALGVPPGSANPIEPNRGI